MLLTTSSTVAVVVVAVATIDELRCRFPEMIRYRDPRSGHRISHQLQIRQAGDCYIVETVLPRTAGAQGTNGNMKEERTKSNQTGCKCTAENSNCLIASVGWLLFRAVRRSTGPATMRLRVSEYVENALTVRMYGGAGRDGTGQLYTHGESYAFMQLYKTAVACRSCGGGRWRRGKAQSAPKYPGQSLGLSRSNNVQQ